MPDAGGNIKGIALNGKAGETLDRIFPKSGCDHCDDTKLVYDPCDCYDCEYDDKHGRWSACANCQH